MGTRSAARVSVGVLEDGKSDTRKPPHPLRVLTIAVMLPGVGQVLNNTPRRGLMFLFFIFMFGWVTYHLAAPERSFVGRFAGGLFVYAISIMDAYRWARYRWTLFHNNPPPQGAERSN